MIREISPPPDWICSVCFGGDENDMVVAHQEGRGDLHPLHYECLRRSFEEAYPGCPVCRHPLSLDGEPIYRWIGRAFLAGWVGQSMSLRYGRGLRGLVATMGASYLVPLLLNKVESLIFRKAPQESDPDQHSSIHSWFESRGYEVRGHLNRIGYFVYRFTPFGKPSGFVRTIERLFFQTIGQATWWQIKRQTADFCFAYSCYLITPPSMTRLAPFWSGVTFALVGQMISNGLRKPPVHF